MSDGDIGVNKAIHAVGALRIGCIGSMKRRRTAVAQVVVTLTEQRHIA